MSTMTESDRIKGLERQLDEMTARLVTSQEQTAQALAQTDRAIEQAASAIAEAQRYLGLYQSEVAKRSDAAHDEGKTK